MAKRKHNKGMFNRGPDPRRHTLTPADRVKGFWNAIYSITTRYPDAVDSSGRHMACDFLKVAGRQNKERAR